MGEDPFSLPTLAVFLWCLHGAEPARKPAGKKEMLFVGFRPQHHRV